MTEELVSYGFVAALLLAVSSLVVSFHNKQEEKKAKRVPIKVRRRR